MSPFRFPPGKLPRDVLSRELIPHQKKDPQVLVPPAVGEDATVLLPATDAIAVTTDPITFVSDDISLYAVDVNVNDLATMGARPKWFLVNFLLPPASATEDAVHTLFEDLRPALEKRGVALVGGHSEITDAVTRPLVMGVLIGEVESDAVIRSDGATDGDQLLLTKGISIEGTSILAREMEEVLRDASTEEEIDRAKGLLHDPGICVFEEAQIAVATGTVNAMHDPTEGGLAMGLHELASAAKVGLRVFEEALPILPSTRRFAACLDFDPLGLIASGALLIASPPGSAEAIAEAIRDAGIACALIGEVVEAERGVQMIRSKGAKESPLVAFERDELARLFERSSSENG